MKGSNNIIVQNSSGDSYTVFIPEDYTFNVNLKNEYIVTSSDGISQVSSEAIGRIDKNVKKFNKDFNKYIDSYNIDSSSDGSQEASLNASYNASYNASMESLYNSVSEINTNIYGLGIAFLVLIVFYVVFKEIRGWR